MEDGNSSSACLNEKQRAPCRKLMKVAIIGTGYVGLPTGVGLAELGHEVVCIDREVYKIEKLQAGQVTLYEDGLDSLLQKNFKSGHIKFTTSMSEGVKGAQVVVIAVGTPPHPVTHEADMRYVYEAATELASCLKDNEYTVVANKSTVPVGTGDNVESLIAKNNPDVNFDVVSLPEFLREGYAVHDFFHPDRIVVGANTERAREVIREMYKPLLALNPQCTLLCVKRRSSETIKYAANSFLATKIHFINEMADFCECTGADIYEVAQGMGLDKRIGKSFLQPGPGFGGSCFPKDTMAIDFMARQNNVNLSIVRATIDGNNKRIKDMATRILEVVEHEEAEPCFGILGLAFKNGTDDCRVSPAMQILQEILHRKPKCSVRVFDPEAMENARLILQPYMARVTFCDSALEVCNGADVLAVLTEWPEFSELDLAQAAPMMRHQHIIDCRNMLSPQKALNLGFTFRGIGLGRS